MTTVESQSTRISPMNNMTPTSTTLSLAYAIAAVLFLPWQTATAQERSADEPVVVQLTLHPCGFIPSEITVAEGLIDLEIVSRVGFPELPILIEWDGQGVQQKQTLRNENHDARKRNTFSDAPQKIDHKNRLYFFSATYSRLFFGPASAFAHRRGQNGPEGTERPAATAPESPIALSSQSLRALLLLEWRWPT